MLRKAQFVVESFYKICHKCIYIICFSILTNSNSEILESPSYNNYVAEFAKVASPGTPIQSLALYVNACFVPKKLNDS